MDDNHGRKHSLEYNNNNETNKANIGGNELHLFDGIDPSMLSSLQQTLNNDPASVTRNSNNNNINPEYTLTSQEQSRLEETARQLQRPPPPQRADDTNNVVPSRPWQNAENDQAHRAEMVEKVYVTCDMPVNNKQNRENSILL